MNYKIVNALPVVLKNVAVKRDMFIRCGLSFIVIYKLMSNLLPVPGSSSQW